MSEIDNIDIDCDDAYPQDSSYRPNRHILHSFVLFAREKKEKKEILLSDRLMRARLFID